MHYIGHRKLSKTKGSLRPFPRWLLQCTVLKLMVKIPEQNKQQGDKNRSSFIYCHRKGLFPLSASKELHFWSGINMVQKGSTQLKSGSIMSQSLVLAHHNTNAHTRTRSLLMRKSEWCTMLQSSHQAAVIFGDICCESDSNNMQRLQLRPSL